MKKYMYLKIKMIIGALVVLLLAFPISLLDFNIPKLIIDNKVSLDILNLMISCLILGYFLLNDLIKRKKENMLKNSKVYNYVLDNLFLIFITILLSSNGYILGIIPIVLIINFIINFMFNKKEQRTLSIIKTCSLVISIMLVLNNNMPFVLWDLNVHYMMFIFVVIINICDTLNFVLPREKNINEEE